MRLLTHRAQVLLLVVVGVLGGLALCCLGLELLGVPVLEPLGVDELFTRHEPTLPSRIVIEGGGAQTDQDSMPASPTPVAVPKRRLLAPSGQGTVPAPATIAPRRGP